MRSAVPRTSSCSSTSCIPLSERARPKGRWTLRTLSNLRSVAVRCSALGPPPSTNIGIHRKRRCPGAAFPSRQGRSPLCRPGYPNPAWAQGKVRGHHKVTFTDAAIEASVRLSDRYLTGRYLPDKAIDLMDEAGSRARIGATTRPPEINDSKGRSTRSPSSKSWRSKQQDFEAAAALRDKEKQAMERWTACLKTWRATREEKQVRWMRTISSTSWPSGRAFLSNGWSKVKRRSFSRWKKNWPRRDRPTRGCHDPCANLCAAPGLI